MRVLMTGGYGCIGSWVAKQLVDGGQEVWIFDLKEDTHRLDLLLTSAERDRVHFLPGDVSDPALLKMSVDIAEDAFGRLTTVLLNAGITAGQSGVENLDIAGYRRIMAVNVDHVVFGLTAAVPALRRAGGGHIVVTASLAGLVPMPGDALYTLTKHAVVGYVRAAAPTLGAEGIRVNAVCPGFADTPLLAAARDRFGDFPLLSAEDVADAVEAVLERGEPGECWFCQPGREPAPYGFRGVPGPAGGVAPPPVDWADH